MQQNLLAAYKNAVTLITGSDAGNMLVIHGPTVQHEMELWVKAGIPPAVALQAGTYNAAKVLRADKRLGLVQKGYDATFILLDGNPLQDIGATEQIHSVIFKGQEINRVPISLLKTTIEATVFSKLSTAFFQSRLGFSHRSP